MTTSQLSAVCVIGAVTIAPATPTVGIYKEMGLVDGQWVDTIFLEKLL